MRYTVLFIVPTISTDKLKTAFLNVTCDISMSRVCYEHDVRPSVRL